MRDDLPVLIFVLVLVIHTLSTLREIRAKLRHQTKHLTARAACSIFVSDQGVALSIFVAHVDGGSHGNPGPSGIGVVMQPADGEKIRISKWIGHQDNNVAEYVALLEALQDDLQPLPAREGQEEKE